VVIIIQVIYDSYFLNGFIKKI